MNSSHRRQEKGAVLVISMIMLLILTIIGTAAMDTTNLQTRMASNAQSRTAVYQASLSEIDYQLAILFGDKTKVNEALLAGNVEVLYEQVAMSTADVKYQRTFAIEYLGEGRPPAGYSLNAFTGYRFQLNSVAVLTDTSIQSNQTQGMTYAGPK